MAPPVTRVRVAECWTQAVCVRPNPASKIADVDLFVFLIGVASKDRAQPWVLTCFKRNGGKTIVNPRRVEIISPYRLPLRL